MRRKCSSAIYQPVLGLFILLGVGDVGRAQTATPPPLQGPITKCDAKLEYFSSVKPTGKEPPYQLTNLIRNEDTKTVSDIVWAKPTIFSSELNVGETVEDSYPISDYVHDKDAPIKIWYQGCVAPAEAYLLAKGEKADKRSDLSLRSLLRHFVEAKPETAESAEIVVSLQGEYIQFEITRRPANLQVGLSGIEGWMTPGWTNAAESNAKEFGYSVVLRRPVDVLGPDQLERIGAEWAFQPALFTAREIGGDSGFVRLRLPIVNANARTTRATVILARANKNIVATGSYATFTPDR